MKLRSLRTQNRYTAIAIALASMIGTMSGCGAIGTFTWVDDLPAEYFKPQSPLAIWPGDTVSIRVFGQEPLSAARVTVRMDGTLAMPLIGSVAVSGRTPEEVAKEVESRLLPYVTTPNVLVLLEERRTRIVVIGEVRRPGTLALEAGETGLLAALANAGGLTEFASKTRVFVLRSETAQVHRIRFDYDDIVRGVGRAGEFRLRTGDQLVVE